ncbi:hypothetical protein Taro_053419 [Colocasia esculenta]|uniref:Glutaredoxin domain-containing protein n=1 Tax=Colocasia esculenta TaxID=4460 RepID=A0A843XL77_COLES|nr:hypothetical protein [Colocasia esculenta]
MALEKAKKIVSSNPAVVFRFAALPWVCRSPLPSSVVSYGKSVRFRGWCGIGDRVRSFVVAKWTTWGRYPRKNAGLLSIVTAFQNDIRWEKLSLNCVTGAGMGGCNADSEGTFTGCLRRLVQNGFISWSYLDSKTFCPFCTRAKQLLTQLGAQYKVIELDEESDGSEIQSALAQWTGQRTVPNVFIGGNHIGGCDTITELHREGKLVPLLTEAGALASSAA